VDTKEFMLTAFSYGYSSGDVLSEVIDASRKSEEAKLGGSLNDVVQKAMRPFITPNSRILELGPGAGSWTRALLNLVPHGEVHTIDFLDVTKFIDPAEYSNRLFCHQIANDDYSFLPDNFFDFYFSFGVFVHYGSADRLRLLKKALPKMRARGYAVHEYGDWKKLDAYGWDRGGVPEDFKDKPDEEIWWPRNDAHLMAATARVAGWNVIASDLGLFLRDGVIVLSRPG
jgi:hypothetical protein